MMTHEHDPMTNEHGKWEGPGRLVGGGAEDGGHHAVLTRYGLVHFKLPVIHKSGVNKAKQRPKKKKNWPGEKNKTKTRQENSSETMHWSLPIYSQSVAFCTVILYRP